MGFQTIKLSFTLTREQFVHLLLLNGKVRVEDDNNTVIILNGIRKHNKFGKPGIEDGSDHFFSTEVSYNSKHTQADALVSSTDSGKTYKGSIIFEIFFRSAN